jgi:predicted ribosomally synthesized peptide with SipW-like signal peptide
MTIVAVFCVVGAGTLAYFSDTETSSGNKFIAGTLDLKVNDKDDPEVDYITVENMKPGDSGSYTWTAKNVGSITGSLTLVVSAITNDDNFCNEPEAGVPDNTPGDAEGKGGGELGDYLDVVLKVNGEKMYEGPLNGMTGTYRNVTTLAQNETADVKLEWSIDSEVGNIIQSDSAEFDITFQLDQAE